MKLRPRVVVVFVVALLALSAAPLPCRVGHAGTTAQDALTPQERRGKEIYTRGTSPSGREILAYVGDSALEVPGGTMACVNCHGADGRGRPEGSVIPTNLTPEYLTKPYGLTHPGGRKHPPYSDRTIGLAITRGLDPAGNRLLGIMPRYRMSQEDLADLLAYLKRLGKETDPGVTEGGITIGTVVPGRGELAGLGQAVRAVLSAFFAEVNSQGGIYNRKVELKFVETADTPAATGASVGRFIRDEQVFALTGAFTAGAEREMASLMGSMEVPLVGPFTLYPQVGHPLNRHVFYLFSGLEEQARALVNFASRQPAGEKADVLIVYPEGERASGVAEAVKDQCRKNGCRAPQTYVYRGAQFDAADAAGRLGRAGQNGVVFFLGTGAEASALMKEAAKLGWSPQVYLPGGAVGNEVFDAPQSFSRKIFLSFPTSPADQTAAGMGEFRALAAKHGLPAHHLAAQLSAFGAARILVEGLRRAGREVSREKLVEALEGLSGYASGVTPAVTYGPNRRVGATGAHVVTIDLEKRQFVPVGPWVDAN